MYQSQIPIKNEFGSTGKYAIRLGQAYAYIRVKIFYSEKYIKSALFQIQLQQWRSKCQLSTEGDPSDYLMNDNRVRYFKSLY